ncbi:MAG TPA: rhodanese-like domain-containing protein [Ktedonobacteraceae bacterium]|nr:rhodanese-like domain-containing protein [Ktedonobacteraceae bacterium]
MVFQHLFHRSSVEEVSAEEAKAKQKAGAVIIDVREPHEWREGYIPGAKLIPLGSLAKRAQELDSSKEIIAVCRSGNRSISAALILQRAGFTQASSMAGGMISWIRHRYPVSRA